TPNRRRVVSFQTTPQACKTPERRRRGRATYVGQCLSSEGSSGTEVPVAEVPCRGACAATLVQGDHHRGDGPVGGNRPRGRLRRMIASVQRRFGSGRLQAEGPFRPRRTLRRRSCRGPLSWAEFRATMLPNGTTPVEGTSCSGASAVPNVCDRKR